MFRDEQTLVAPPDRPLRLWIEPWGDEREIPAGSTVVLRAVSAQEGRLEIVPAQDATWIYGWPGSTIEVLVGGQCVVSFDIPPPSLPEGMSMRGFIGGVLGAVPKTQDGDEDGGALPPGAPKSVKRPWWRFWGRR